MGTWNNLGNDLDVKDGLDGDSRGDLYSLCRGLWLFDLKLSWYNLFSFTVSQLLDPVFVTLNMYCFIDILLLDSTVLIPGTGLFHISLLDIHLSSSKLDLQNQPRRFRISYT